jgi:uncharacterized membrane protein (DUF485 family)
MSDRSSPRSGALDVLTHFLPQNILQDLREQALSFQRQETFRTYVLRRMWFVIPVALAFAAVSFAAAAGSVIFASRFVTQPVSGWTATAIFALGAVVWVGGVISQLYILFRWLENKALRQTSTANPRRMRS